MYFKKMLRIKMPDETFDRTSFLWDLGPHS